MENGTNLLQDEKDFLKFNKISVLGNLKIFKICFITCH